MTVGGETGTGVAMSYGRLLKLAGPLILSQMGVMLMQMVDGIFLARYSETAIAAVSPAGLSFWMICGFFIGITGYSNTFVAQYVGSGRPDRAGAAVWQAVYLSVGAGALLAISSVGARAFFAWVGHAPEIQVDEVAYYRILAWGGPLFLLSAALSGFFSGRHDNHWIMIAHFSGGIVNAVMDALLIFGVFGFAEMGIAGAAWATVMGQGVQVILLGARFFAPRFRSAYGSWQGRKPDGALIARYLRYGTPNAVRMVVEIGIWAIFLLIVGRIDSTGLAASNIAWRINGLSFFPVLGLSIAVSMMVGQAQGAGRPDLARVATRHGLVAGQAWMMAMALLMVLWPDVFLRLFLGADAPTGGDGVYRMTVLLLRFVAVYCLADGINIILMAMLAGAGDTRWLMIATVSSHLVFIGSLLLLERMGFSVYTLWIAATVFICTMAWLWIMRFRSKAWENRRVVETKPL